jgi:glycosyltransferase involved in cell wall biosynthesis
MLTKEISRELIKNKNEQLIGLSVVILSYNESIHIKRAVENVIDWCDEVVVLDSNSTDDTAAIAEATGAKVFYRNFDNYMAQRNHAIHELPLQNEWMIFLDADEYISEALKNEIAQLLLGDPAHDGYMMKRRFIFKDRWIRFGGYYPIWILRLFKRSKGNVDREINEHVTVSGTVGNLKNDFSDHNLKSLADWIEKHNRYSNYEAQQFLNHHDRKHTGEKDQMAKLTGNSAERKRWIRQNIWNEMPPFVRPFVYFTWRYFFRFGFLDGKAGFIYHYLHGFWYPFITDVKYLELKKQRNLLEASKIKHDKSKATASYQQQVPHVDESA